MNTDKPDAASHYPALLSKIKQRIRSSQTRAMLAARLGAISEAHCTN